jgi:hypothetical protein
MRRALLVIAMSLGVVATASTPSYAGLSGAHFNNVTITIDGNTITAEGREAGLGNVDQVHIVLSATALCINGGGRHPRAVNKTGVAAGGDFPVQNGHADFWLSGTATFEPSCSPPMTVQFTDITVTDTTSGVTYTYRG